MSDSIKLDNFYFFILKLKIVSAFGLKDVFYPMAVVVQPAADIQLLIDCCTIFIFTGQLILKIRLKKSITWL
jgi:hypothetical protein